MARQRKAATQTALAATEEGQGQVAVLEDARTTGDEALIALWLHGRSPHTQRAYREHAARFLAFLRQRRGTVIQGDDQAPADQPTPAGLATATLEDAQAFADHLKNAGLAPASRSSILAGLKSLLTFAQRTGALPYNVGAALRLPGTKSTLAERILDEESVHRLLTLESNPRNHALLRLLYGAGLRAAEACALRWRDVVEREDAGQVSVYGKGEKSRTVLLSAGTWRAVRALRPVDAAPDTPVFRSRKGGAPLTPVQVWRIMRAAALRAGITEAASPHWLRHAHASHALDRGAAISLVRETLGHASIATTGRYLHARPNDSSGRYLGM